MAEKMTKIVVRVQRGHPTGLRNRAGYKFTEAATEVNVNKDELEMIQNDPYLLIVTAGNALKQAKWVKPEKLKTQENIENKTDPIDPVDPIDPPVDPIFKKDIEVELKGFEIEYNWKDKRDVLHAQLLAYVVEKLTEKGMTEGEDFTPESDIRDLIALLKAE